MTNTTDPVRLIKLDPTLEDILQACINIIVSYTGTFYEEPV